MRMATSSSTRPGMTKLSTRSDGRRPKSAKARNRGGVRDRRCRGGYGDLAAAGVVGEVSLQRRLDGCSSDLLRAWWPEPADRRLLDRICGSVTGQFCGPAQAGVLPSDSWPE